MKIQLHSKLEPITNDVKVLQGESSQVKGRVAAIETLVQGIRDETAKKSGGCPSLSQSFEPKLCRH